MRKVFGVLLDVKLEGEWFVKLLVTIALLIICYITYFVNSNHY